MDSIRFLIVLLALAQYSVQITLLKRPKNASIKIAFGSCAKFYWDDDVPIFSTIANEYPDVFIWLGDAAYLDDQKVFYIYSTFPTIKKAEKRLGMTKIDEGKSSSKK